MTKLYQVEPIGKTFTTGNSYLTPRHTGSKFKWNAPEAEFVVKTENIPQAEVTVPVQEMTASA
jgi:hypothetical protein